MLDISDKEVLTMKITKRAIMAADDFGDEDLFGDEPEVTGDESDTAEEEILDDEEVEEADIQEDDPEIDVDNNIVDHLIAECDNCKGIFISAMIASEQDVQSINGVCPLCNKDTTQTLKWIIKEYPED